MKIDTTFEKNSNRRAYRTNIPIVVAIENNKYHTIDWSLAGLAIKGLKENITIGQTTKAYLILQMAEANISLPITIKLEYKKDDRYGFSYADISQNNKKVLKRFIEFSIDGKLDMTDKIVSLYEEPNVHTPIETPVKLDFEESRSLKRSFYANAFRYLLFAGLIFSLLALILFDKIKYSYQADGIIIKNYQKIYPRINNIIEKIYVKEGQKVHKGDLLVEFDSEKARYKIDLLEAEKEQLIKEQKRQSKKEEMLLSSQINEKLVPLLSKRVKELKKDFLNAKIQYNKRVINYTDYLSIKNEYIKTKIELEANKNRALKEKSKIINNGLLMMSTKDYDLKIKHAKHELNYYHLTSPVDGVIYEINSIEGEMSDKSRPIFTIWTKQKPIIEVKVPIKDISKITPNTRADIVDRLNNKNYKAKIQKIGSANDEESSNEVTVLLKPIGDVDLFKPNQHVEVLFERVF